MDEPKQRSNFIASATADKAVGQPRRPKQWLAHAGHGSVMASEKGPHVRVYQGPSR